MKHRRIIFTYLLLNVFSAKVIAQKPTETTIPVFFEKVYVHTDRDVYGQGEDIWFKAYLVNAQNNQSINYSHNLYVELISPSAKVVHRELIRLENSLGNGDFKLSDSVVAGHYRLRAYTNWMRNFGDNFVFEKSITILQTSATQPVADPKSIAAKNNKKGTTANVTATLNTATSTLPVVRFFPEGGDLVNGLSSVVGVKAEDEAGNGVAASGKVVDNAGVTMTEFSCDSLGFGSMALLPISGQHYQALMMIHGKEQRFVLPEVRAGGFSLQLHYLGQDTVKAVVSAASSSTSGKHPYLVSKHAGKSYVRQAVVLNGNRMVVAIPDALLPEGISEFTLYDEQNQPQCERLVYIHHPDQIKLSLSTELPVYAPKGEVQVKLKLSTKEKANLSMVAVDAATVPVPEENILSYLNLQSEVRGTIEHPDRYFDTTNVNRATQLDQLLLTQGWRDFVWKKIADTALNISYQPEQGINITGRVRRVLANKPLAGIDVTMRAPKADGQKLFWATTDSAGRFSIYDTKFYGYQYLSFTSRKSDKINRDGESKGSSGGYIQVDSLQSDPLPVHAVPAALQADTSWRASLQADAEMERIRKALNLKASHNLKEVTIKANTSRLVTQLPPEIHPITLVEQKEYDNLGEYLLYMIEGAGYEYGACLNCSALPETTFGPFLIQKGFPKKTIRVSGKYADGSPINCYVCQDQYLNLRMSDVLKLTINRSEDIFGKNISVSVVLRTGVLDVKSYFDYTMADMTGYYKAREFYKPKLEKPDAIDPRTNTIHWEPNITTNEKGEATVTFYNTAQTGKIRLVAEGISSNGTPLAATASYEVK